MTTYNPLEMLPREREAFLEWIVAEGLNPVDIQNDGRFRVHNGRISGHMFVRGEDGKLLARKDKFVTKPFNVEQKHPVPKPEFVTS